jgi:TRAP-type C4-dicarboxylate transport system permease small subunit
VIAHEPDPAHLSIETTAALEHSDPGGVREANRAIDQETAVETLCRLLCEVSLVALTLMMVMEVVVRALFNVSFQVTDELSGYLLIVISFLSLPVCERHGAFHEIEFVQNRLSERGRVLSKLAFNVLIFLFSVVLTWQFTRFVVKTWRSEETGQTILFTPLWIPRLALALGFAALLITVGAKLVADMRRLRGTGRGTFQHGA